jgi:hypothetical protein
MMENQHNEAKPQLELIPAVAGFKSLQLNTRVLYPDVVSFFRFSDICRKEGRILGYERVLTHTPKCGGLSREFLKSLFSQLVLLTT